jgi:spore germination cell wall hydrolase CwlJ-like protein
MFFRYFSRGRLSEMNNQIIMAKTIFGEARGEYKKVNCGVRSLIAVGNVIMNRHIRSGRAIDDVCLQPRQFSCWNRLDPNRNLLDGPLTGDKIFEVCLDVAGRIIEDKIDDITNGADHYYSRTVGVVPYWATDQQPVFEIGSHIFFRLLPFP